MLKYVKDIIKKNEMENTFLVNIADFSWAGGMLSLVEAKLVATT